VQSKACIQATIGYTGFMGFRDCLNSGRREQKTLEKNFRKNFTLLRSKIEEAEQALSFLAREECKDKLEIGDSLARAREDVLEDHVYELLSRGPLEEQQRAFTLFDKLIETNSVNLMAVQAAQELCAQNEKTVQILQGIFDDNLADLRGMVHTLKEALISITQDYETVMGVYSHFVSSLEDQDLLEDIDQEARNHLQILASVRTVKI
jgi:hypothetical protein